MSKKFIYIAMVILLIHLSTLLLINNLKNNKIEAYLLDYTQNKQKQYELVYNSFRKIAINSFYGVIQKKEITDIYKNINEDDKNNAKLRNDLYKLLKKDYRRLRMLGINYLDFHLKSGKSFLRMGKKDYFGDDVFLFRPSLRYVSQNNMAYEGLEEGGLKPAFRFVYPLVDEKGKYLGSAEVSFDISELKNVFERSFETSVNVIFKNTTLQSNSYRKIEDDYLVSKEHSQYFISKETSGIKFNEIEQLSKGEFASLKQTADERISNSESFSLYKHKGDLSKVVTFLAQKNELTNKTVAYVVIYDNDRYIKSLDDEFFNMFLGTLLLYFLILYIVYAEFKKQEILEKLVTKKTKEIRKLFNHELYLKSLLETVANVNESLIRSYSLGSIIKSSLDKLQEHKSYKLVTYGHVEKGLIHMRYVQGDNYGLIKDETIECKRDIKNHILKSAVSAVNKKKTVIDNDLYIDLSSITINDHMEFLLKSSISLLLRDENSEIFGVLTLFSENESFDDEEISLLETLSSDISMAINISRQRKMVEQLQIKQIANYEETVLAFVDMIEHRDAYTAGHTLRVAKYCRMIARKFDIEEDDVKKLEKAAILHDIGKIATPDTILLKPGRLTSLEYNLIKEHVDAGYQMLSKVELYKDLAQIIKFHHEHYDGTGYPNGIKGESIPFLAHILIVADAFDAMTTNRIYKSRLTPKEAIEEIKLNSGTQFHPKVALYASEVLINVDIEQTTQLPKTSLEKQRFAYFFNDNLTNVYNEQYLELVLNSPDEFVSLYKIELKQMSQFNKENGWAEGNKLIASLAKYLQKNYSNCLIFRFQGDDFIVLSKYRIDFNISALDNFFSYYDIIEYDVNHIDIKDRNYKSFKDLLFN